MPNGFDDNEANQPTRAAMEQRTDAKTKPARPFAETVNPNCRIISEAAKDLAIVPIAVAMLLGSLWKAEQSAAQGTHLEQDECLWPDDALVACGTVS